MAKKAAGGNVAFNTAGAKVNINEKSALIAVPVDKPSSKKEPVKAKTMDEALSHLNVSYDVNLRKTDGTSSKEKISINEMEDFEETKMVENSKTLSDQKKQMEFLFDFQYELQNNPILVDELKAFLAGNKKSELVEFLRKLKTQMKSKDSEFIKFLKR